MMKEACYAVERSRLEGRVHVGGAKNSALRLLAGSLLTSEKVELDNYPDSLLDARVHIEMLQVLGKTCTVSGGYVCIEEPAGISSDLSSYEGRSIRNTLLILGALVARTGKGKVPLPGGCKLGDRKYDLHVMLLEALGCRVWEEGDYLCAESKDSRLKGRDIFLPIRSTGATENAILCGTLAEGVTRIWNPHVRPEILDLIAMLRSMGGEIEVRGQESIIVHGKDGLGGVRHKVIPDNVEALTWMIGATITKGDVEITGFPLEDLELPLIYLRESGLRYYQCNDSVIVRGGICFPVEISTGPYPGINSDMQPLFAVFGSQALGETRIVDLRFPGRYHYAEELGKMGLKYTVEDNLLKIRGGQPLRGTEVRALDLRAGISLLLAGLVADGATLIRDAWQIDRGYDRLGEKMAQLGGRLKKYDRD